MNTPGREIRVAAMTRVEGEGALHVTIDGNAVGRVELQIYEPPRLFEALLRGRSIQDVPDIVARICGICPVAYQMSAVHAIERALKITINPDIRRLRRLLYCGEWIESHALHMHLLHAPDFLNCDSGMQLAERFPMEIQRGLRLRQIGNRLLEVLGGRAIHPVNVAIGGFHQIPPASSFASLVADFEWGLAAAVATTEWVAKFACPDFQVDYDFVALQHDEEYPMNDGVIASSRGESWTADAFEDEFQERQVPYSTAMHAFRRSSDQPYLVGPLARLHLNRDRLAAEAQEVLAKLAWPWPNRNPFASIVARGLELIHAFSEGLSILRHYANHTVCRETSQPSISGPWDGAAATEAPRGLLFHRFQGNEQARVTLARIIPPTSQNQSQIEQDLRGWVARVLSYSDEELGKSCERLVRSYDPCISCATHFLKVKIDRK